MRVPIVSQIVRTLLQELQLSFASCLFGGRALDTPPKNSFRFCSESLLHCFWPAGSMWRGRINNIAIACITVFLVLLSLPSTIGSIGQK